MLGFLWILFLALGPSTGPTRLRRGRPATSPWRSALSCVSGAMMAVELLAPPSAQAAVAGKQRLDGVVNVNTASVDLLVLLPGLGPSKVEGILLYRRKRPFRTVDELGRVKGIGPRMVRELRPHLAVAGPSTATLVRVKTDWEALRRLGEVPEPPKAQAPASVQPKAKVAAPVTSDRRGRGPSHGNPPRWRRPAAVPCLGPA